MFEPGRALQMPRTHSGRRSSYGLSAFFFCLMTAAVLVAAVLLAAGPARADFAEGLEAFDGGDLDRAIAAWRDAAALGDLDAVVALADLHYQGIGLPRDASAAAALYRKAAEAGHKIARLNLGELHDLGEGVARDPARAYYWWSLAADQGSLWAARARQDLSSRLTAEERSAADLLLAQHRDTTDITNP